MAIRTRLAIGLMCLTGAVGAAQIDRRSPTTEKKRPVIANDPVQEGATLIKELKTQLIQLKSELKLAKSDLSAANANLKRTERELSETKVKLEKSEGKLHEANELFNDTLGALKSSRTIHFSDLHSLLEGVQSPEEVRIFDGDLLKVDDRNRTSVLKKKLQDLIKDRIQTPKK